MTSLLQGSRQDSHLESSAWPAVRTCVIGSPGITVVVRTRGFFGRVLAFGGSTSGHYCTRLPSEILALLAIVEKHRGERHADPSR